MDHTRYKKYIKNSYPSIINFIIKVIPSPPIHLVNFLSNNYLLSIKISSQIPTVRNHLLQCPSRIGFRVFFFFFLNFSFFFLFVYGLIFKNKASNITTAVTIMVTLRIRIQRKNVLGHPPSIPPLLM